MILHFSDLFTKEEVRLQIVDWLVGWLVFLDPSGNRNTAELNTTVMPCPNMGRQALNQS